MTPLAVLRWALRTPSLVDGVRAPTGCTGGRPRVVWFAPTGVAAGRACCASPTAGRHWAMPAPPTGPCTPAARLPAVRCTGVRCAGVRCAEARMAAPRSAPASTGPPWAVVAGTAVPVAAAAVARVGSAAEAGSAVVAAAADQAVVAGTAAPGGPAPAPGPAGTGV